MDLLVLKSNEKYIRIKDDTFEYTNMDKASVFPVVDVEKVKGIYRKLLPEISDLEIRKIVITETKFIEE